MKKFMLTLATLLVMAVSANAMGYEQARRQALFLTDKMAYELNLTEDQYEAAFEINLDYLLSVNDYNDLYGAYWTHRNLDFSYILLDWQYSAFCAASYFYRPLYWDAGYWHFGIYARYPHRDYFYYGYPRFYTVYRGGHSWHHNGGRSWYHGRDWGPRPGTPRDRHVGMRNGFDRGDYRHGFDNNHNNQSYRGRGFGSMSSRPTTTQPRGGHDSGSQPRGSYGSGSQPRHQSYGTDRSFGSRESSTRTTVTRPNSTERSSGSSSFGNRGSRSYSGSSTPSRSFTPSTSTPSRSYSTPSRSGSGSFGGGSRSYSSPSHSSGGSFGGSHGGGSHGGSSHSSGGSRSFGGHR